MINLNNWPFDQPERERELMADALDQVQTMGQAEQVLGAFLLGDILVDILTAPPVWREYWWQLWRPRRRTR